MEKEIRVKLGFFLHIPFLPWDIFRFLPWANQVVDGLISCGWLHQMDYLSPLRLLASADKAPHYIEQVVLLQIAVPSRTDVEEYRTLKEEMDKIVGKVRPVTVVSGQLAAHSLHLRIDIASRVGGLLPGPGPLCRHCALWMNLGPKNSSPVKPKIIRACWSCYRSPEPVRRCMKISNRTKWTKLPRWSIGLWTWQAPTPHDPLEGSRKVNIFLVATPILVL